MSAWGALVNVDESDEHLELCNAALKEIKAEARAAALREFADRCDTELAETVKERIGGIGWEIRSIPTARQASDLARRMAEEGRS